MRTNFRGGKKINEKQIVQRLQNLTSTIVTRSQLGQRLGQSFEGDRELYDICGYDQTMTYEQYRGRYTRDPLAKRIVDAYPNATWTVQPDVYDTDKETESSFEEAWQEMIKDPVLKLMQYFSRVDKVAGIGRYGVLYLGYDDGKDAKEEVKGSVKLIYVQAFGEGTCQIVKVEESSKSPRYGKPTLYKITPNNVEENVSRSAVTTTVAAGSVKPFEAHWTRIIHVADGTIDNDVYGTPRLECVWNRLQDIETVCGGSAEMFWRAGFPGLQFVTPPDAQVADESALTDEIEEYIHGLSRYMRLQNMEAKAIPAPGAVTAPDGYFNIFLAQISAATGIPVRILVGSERGELASSQDERGWHDRIKERRMSFATDVVRTFILRMVLVGALPEPDDLKVTWPPIEELNESEKMDIANKKTKAMVDYINGGVDALMTPVQFFTEVLGYSADEAATMLDEVEDYQKELFDDAQNAQPPPQAPGEVAGGSETGPQQNPPPVTNPTGPQPVPPPAQARRQQISKGKKTNKEEQK